jgi:hypothetical protein
MKHVHALAAVACVVLASTSVAAPALAARGGGGGGGGAGTTTSSSIWLASVDGWSTAGRTAVVPTVPYGSRLTFGTSVEPLAGWEYAMVSLACYRDVDGNGVVDMSLTGPDVVLTQLDRPDATFVLGGYSIWTNLGGGAATCRADLDAYGVKGGRQTIRVLQSLPLTVTA